MIVYQVGYQRSRKLIIYHQIGAIHITINDQVNLYYILSLDVMDWLMFVILRNGIRQPKDRIDKDDY